MTLQSIFSSLLVVETATILAGPSIGMFFAELGATVVKVEDKNRGGDTTRGWKLKTESPEQDISAYFASINWGKKSIALNLRDDVDKQILNGLLDRADIWLHNFPPARQAKLGLTYAELSTRNPELIVGQVLAFDEKDPRPGFDAALQAETGFMAINGVPDGPPTKMPVALIDVLAAHQLKEALLLALFERHLTGRGSEVTASLFQSGVSSLINQASNFLVAGHIPQRMGSDHPNISPYGTAYTAADGKQLILAVGTERQFESLCKILGCEELLEDERFISNKLRVPNNEALKAYLKEAISRFERDDLLQQLNDASIPSGAVRTMDEVFEEDAAAPMILEGEVDGEVIRGVRAVSFEPPNELMLQCVSPPPHLDQHRAEVMEILSQK